jgi:hypothetical protein
VILLLTTPAAFRQALRDQSGWRVKEAAGLGLFAFAKFLMWRDLTDRLDEPLKSPLVRHILQRTKLPDELCQLPAGADDLGATLDPVTVVCPLDADPTQIRAIVAAAGKTSFVLQGPPGTGKSQTITNLVVNCLAQGKRVLFVSEKIADLNVVKKRLVRVGLGAFCLELHSNKASVLEQFKYTLAEAERRSPVEWEVTLPVAASALTADQVRGARETVERFVAATEDAGSPADHPLKELRVRWKPGIEQELAHRGSPSNRICLRSWQLDDDEPVTGFRPPRHGRPKFCPTPDLMAGRPRSRGGVAHSSCWPG